MKWNPVLFCVQIDILQKTTNIYEEDKRALQNELDSRQQRLQRELSEKKRMESRMQGLVSDEKLRWQKECVSDLFVCPKVDLGNVVNVSVASAWF